MFDPKKPARLKNGKKARIICADRQYTSEAAPIAALVENSPGNEDLVWFNADGTPWMRYENQPPLINIPEKHTLRGWVSVFQDTNGKLAVGAIYDTWPDASRASDRPISGYRRIACIEITREFEEGEGL